MIYTASGNPAFKRAARLARQTCKPPLFARSQALLDARFASVTFLCDTHAPSSYKTVPSSESCRYQRASLSSAFITLSLRVPLGVLVLR